MTAVVLKDHHRATFMEARMLNAATPAGGTRAVGSVVLNHSQGGISPAAVAAALELGAGVVWMPTVSAANHQRALAKRHTPASVAATVHPADGDPISVVDASGRLDDAVVEILRLTARAGAVLATGHVSVTEALAVTDAARGVGVRAVVITHPTVIVGASDDDLVRLAGNGAILEHEVSMLLPESPLRAFGSADLRRWIELVGLRSNILASDLGQVGNPALKEGWSRAIEILSRASFTDDEIRWLVADGPRQVLGDFAET
jgi:hypothetical protein